MIQKSSNILYLFDFDGTLFGDNSWSGYIKNTKSCILNGPYFNPNELDIRWAILTGRSKKDVPLIWMICNSNGLSPRKIYTQDTIRNNIFSTKEQIDFKVHKLKSLLNGETETNFIIGKVSKIFYMDSDLDVVKGINEFTSGSSITAVSLLDFKKNQYNIIF